MLKKRRLSKIMSQVFDKKTQKLGGRGKDRKQTLSRKNQLFLEIAKQELKLMEDNRNKKKQEAEEKRLDEIRQIEESLT